MEELGTVLLNSDDSCARITCKHVDDLKQRLKMSTNGLVTHLASVKGLLSAGASFVP